MDKIPSKKNESEHIVNQILLEQLLGELGEKERKLLELRYFEDKTQTQTAKLLDMSQVQVLSLIHIFQKSYARCSRTKELYSGYNWLQNAKFPN